MEVGLNFGKYKGITYRIWRFIELSVLSGPQNLIGKLIEKQKQLKNREKACFLLGIAELY